MTDPSCLFCKIAAGAIPSDKTHEYELVLAFNDINPVAPVHQLIVPKRHIASAVELGEPDESGRRRPVPLEGSEFELEIDTVVYAIGTDANPIIGQTSDIALNRWGFIDTDENLATSIPGVYAGGDIVTGGATVILAMGAGRKAARAMKEYLEIPQ